MSNPFLSKGYIALALIKAKNEIFNENFATTAELNQFVSFMQQEFNKRELGIVITYGLDVEDANIRGGIVTITDRCCLDLNKLSNEILNILTDSSLLLEFFMKVETRRLEILQSLPKYSMDEPASKQLSRVLSKEKI